MLRIPFFSLSILVGFLFFLSILFTSLSYNFNKRQIADAKRNIADIEELINPDLNVHSNSDTDLNSLKQESIHLKNKSENMSRLLIIFFVFIFFWILNMVLKMYRLVFINDLIVNFNQKIQLLSFKLKTDEIIELKYLWSSMKSIDDYNLIVDKINEMERK